jgi:carboxypeptidase C (cathepsin A)
MNKLLLAGMCVFSCAFAQDPKEAKADAAKPVEKTSVTQHTIQIGGQAIAYNATAGTILLKDEKGEPTASLYYTAYTRTGSGDSAARPVAFIYNGGPGGSSAPQHMGAFGPKRVITLDAGSTPPSPYKVVDNTAGCLLNVTDEVFIDPVGTGFSRAVGKAEDKQFWGIDEDVNSLGQFITSYVTRNNRWNSPKFLIGESYGTFRNAALVNHLQSEGMDFNGVVMISTVLDLRTLAFGPGDDLPYVLYLPSYAAAAWYHKALKPLPGDLTAFLKETRQFAAGPYAQALAKGAKIDPAEKMRVLKELARYTGLSEDYLLKADLRVNAFQFMAELQRSSGLMTGRLDARFSGYATDRLSEQMENDPMQAAVFGAFVSSFNRYVREDLKFGQDMDYKLLNDQAGAGWNWKRKRPLSFFPVSPNVEDDLTQAMINNPHLKVEVENCYYDFATPFFASEYTMDHLTLPDKLRANLQLKYYNAGHMMYLHEADLDQLRGNIASFIGSASANSNSTVQER